MPAENPRNGSPYSKNGQVAMVASTATLILAAISTGSRKCVTILNTDATNIVFIGSDNTVNASNGFPLVPGAAIDREYNQSSWGYSIGTPVVAYLTEEGV